MMLRCMAGLIKLDGELMWLIVASCAVAVAGERRHCGHRWRTSLSCGLPLLPSGLGEVLLPIVATACGSRLAR
jgi:hypothetical protein